MPPIIPSFERPNRTIFVRLEDDNCHHGPTVLSNRDIIKRAVASVESSLKVV